MSLSLAGQVSILAECREKASLGQTEEAGGRISGAAILRDGKNLQVVYFLSGFAMNVPTIAIGWVGGLLDS